MKHVVFLAVVVSSQFMVDCPVHCWAVDPCGSSVYCQGKLLDLIQKARIFKDSKTFVDLALRAPPNITEARFSAFLNLTNSRPDKKQIRRFIDQNFVNITELENWSPGDFKEEPKLLEVIENPAVRRFANALVNIWPTLARRVKNEVKINQDKYSLIPIPNGFIIPGGRFKEIYYWDSYWIVKGLLLSDMVQTTKGILENFMYLIEKFGFVPNGSRLYYLNRSQPPLLAQMVGIYIDVTNDVPWIQTHVGTLAKELEWWLHKRTVVVSKDGGRYVLARYASQSATPRPESYYEDYHTCLVHQSEVDKECCYRNLKSAAESGWDFSSRWIVDESGGTKSNITHVQPQRLIPVDLNAYLCRAFQELSRFYRLLGDEESSMRWLELAEAWRKSIEEVLYDKQDGIWYDYDIILGRSRRYFFPSNFAPLWTESYDVQFNDYYGKRAAQYFISQNILRFKGGIPTSLDKSGQQWDLPNAFPPLQEIVILGLKRTNNVEAQSIARNFARRWINSMMREYNSEDAMFEKYSSEHPGSFGGGGEYPVQSGFGWTNGVALSLINEYFSINVTKLGELCHF